MKKIFIDTETTGLDYRKHSIIQIGGIIEIDGIVVEKFNLLLKPHPRAKIDKSALIANNKTEIEISTYPDQNLVFKNFIQTLAKYVDRFDRKDKFFLIGFNNRAFDDFFLRMFFELNGDVFFGSWFWSDSIDVLCLASEYLSYKRESMPNFKLFSVAKELNIEIDETKAHDAAYDVGLTRKIYSIVTSFTF